MDNDDRVGPGRCPTCETPTQRRFRPFCSKRCQDLDLGRWLRGSYRIPTGEMPGEGVESDEDDNPYGGHA
jgi:hypothetical protein